MKKMPSNAAAAIKTLKDRAGEIKIVGMDVSDATSCLCLMNGMNEVICRCSIPTERRFMEQLAREIPNPLNVTIVLEAGTHSRWLSELFQKHGVNVIVANPRKLRVIWDSNVKDDTRDAETLARVAGLDPVLLHPIRHKSQGAHVDLAVIKCRDLLVRTRAKLTNSVRGQLKTVGIKIPSCSTATFAKEARKHIPSELDFALSPLLDTIGRLSDQIKTYDSKIEELSNDKYPETKRLRQIDGVGSLTALTFVLTLESPMFMDHNRDIGPYLGLVPRRDASGDTDKQLSITKAGNAHLRRLLVGCAQYILGSYGKDCDLRRFGQRIAGGGDNKIRKRKAVVAVARKLAVVMHSMWRNQTDYQPFMKAQKEPMQQAV